MDSRTLTDKMQKRGCCFLLLDPICVDSARSLSRSLRGWSTFTPRSAGPHGTRFWLGELPWGAFFKVKLMPPCSKAHPQQNGIFSTCHADIHRVTKRPGRIPEGIFSGQRRGSWMYNISNSFFHLLSPRGHFNWRWARGCAWGLHGYRNSAMWQNETVIVGCSHCVWFTTWFDQKNLIQDIAHRDLKPENILVESRQLITTHVLPAVPPILKSDSRFIVKWDYLFCWNLGFLSLCFKLWISG